MQETYVCTDCSVLYCTYCAYVLCKAGSDSSSVTRVNYDGTVLAQYMESECMYLYHLYKPGV